MSLISPQNLSSKIESPDLILLDVSPASNKAGIEARYPDLMIPHSFVVSIKKELAISGAAFPNTFPNEDVFNSFCKSVGVTADSEIIVYDNLGMYTAPRVWFIFKAMGFVKVSVLNGGLSAWKENGGRVERRMIIERPSNGNFQGKMKQGAIRSYEEVEANISSESFHIIDARSAGRFNGTAPEPRAKLSSGSIAGSTNIPFNDLLLDGKMKSVEELKEVFSGYEKYPELVFSCGSGMTACINLLAADQVVDLPMAIYDGSWSEWAERQKLFS